MALDLYIKNNAICRSVLKTISKMRDLISLRWQLTSVHSKFVGYTIEIIRQSKIKKRTFTWLHPNWKFIVIPWKSPSLFPSGLGWHYLWMKGERVSIKGSEDILNPWCMLFHPEKVPLKVFSFKILSTYHEKKKTFHWIL